MRAILSYRTSPQLTLMLAILIASTFTFGFALGNFQDQQLLVPKSAVKTNRPIIGILTQETNANLTQFGYQYLSALYVKTLESAGARAVPVFVNSSTPEIENMFHSLNGLIFPGGHVKLNVSRYTTVGRKFLDLAVKAYDETGDVFPIWAECLGFELIALIVSGRDLKFGQYDQSFLSLTDARNISLKLILSPDFKSTKLLGSAPDNIIKYMTQNDINYNNHHRGLTPEVFHKDEKLSEFFKIVSTSNDRKGKPFISTMEALKYPIYSFQWHPAKPLFEWTTLKDIRHTEEAVLIAQYFADFFVNQARLSDHRFPSTEEEKKALIYNYTPTYTGDVVSVLQMYFW